MPTVIVKPPWKTFVKDPGAAKTFTINYASPDGTNDAGANDIGYLQSRTISVSAWVVPTGITNVSISNTTTSTSIKVSGGTHKTDYDLVNQITLSDGDTEERTIRVAVRNQ